MDSSSSNSYRSQSRSLERLKLARNLVVGETVFVPLASLRATPASASAFYRTTIHEIQHRSARIDVGGGDTEWISFSKCQRNIGILIVAVGDLESEASLIDPLSKSILQFCRILCSDDYVRQVKIRSIAEFAKIWQDHHRNYSHVVIVGHGDGSRLKFAVDDWVDALGLQDSLALPNVTPKHFINLSCELGKAAYGKPFSSISACASFIAPFHSVHGAVASHFVQSYFIFNLLHGETSKVAFRHARNSVSDRTSFRMWQYGTLVTD